MKASKGKLQVALLPKKPTAKARNQALGEASDADRLAIEGRELYWLPSGGYADSALDRNALDELIGPTTVRTKGTVELLAAKYFT